MLHMLKIGALAALTLGAAAVRAADPTVSLDLWFMVPGSMFTSTWS